MDKHIELGDKIGIGRSADIHVLDDKRVVKLFHARIPMWVVEIEASINSLLSKSGLNVPEIFGTIQINGRSGIIFQRVSGISMLQEIINDPAKLTEYSLLLAQLHFKMHRIQTHQLKSLKEILRSKIERSSGTDDNVKATTLNVLDSLPDGNAVCHNDFHPDNILISSEGPIIIDWPDAAAGNPLADVARTSLILQFGAPHDDRGITNKIASMREYLNRKYLDCYFELSGASQSEYEQWLLPVAVARLSDNILEEKGSILEFIKSLIRKAEKAEKGTGTFINEILT